MTDALSVTQLRDRVGEEVGVSPWLAIDQARIDDFARVTEDFNFIHVDPVRAAETDFGGTIAHGLLTVVIENYPEGQVEQLNAPYHPNDPSMGSRDIPFSKVIYIEQDDFMEDPPKKFFRLGPGREVRLRYAYFITCTNVMKNDAGEVIELRCTYDPETKGGNAPDGRKVKGTIHWVPAEQALQTEIRLYDRLFVDPKPDSNKHEQDWKEFLNPESMVVLKEAFLEPSLATAEKEERFQFERIGYFCVDNKDDCQGKPVFNRTVTLRDSWAKQKDN